MKRFVIFVSIVFVFALALSSCAKKDCPAYAKANTNSEIVG